MRSARTLVDLRCAICERTLLVGERALRFAPHEGGGLVDVLGSGGSAHATSVAEPSWACSSRLATHSYWDSTRWLGR